MASRAQNVSGAFGKRAPGHKQSFQFLSGQLKSVGNIANYGHKKGKGFGKWAAYPQANFSGSIPGRGGGGGWGGVAVPLAT